MRASGGSRSEPNPHPVGALGRRRYAGLPPAPPRTPQHSPPEVDVDPEVPQEAATTDPEATQATMANYGLIANEVAETRDIVDRLKNANWGRRSPAGRVAGPALCLTDSTTLKVHVRNPGVVRADLEAGVRRIAEDRTSGSLDLALAAIELMAYEKDPPLDALRELAGALEAAQPDMAAVRNAARFCVAAKEEAARVPYRDAIKAFVRFVETSRPRAARRVLKVVDRRVRVATLSRSSTVLEALEHLRARDLVAAVAVLESNPGGEGRLSAEALRAGGIQARVVPDGDLDAVASSCDVVLLGADALFRDGGIVNKVLSRGIASRARGSGRPVYAVVETIKLDHRQASTRHATSDPDLFEVVPPALLTALVTERGVLRPDQVADLVGEVRA